MATWKLFRSETFERTKQPDISDRRLK